MNGVSYFSSSYLDARQRFITACLNANAGITSYENTEVPGAEGERLYADVTLIGGAGAPNLLVISSGTHGVEGFCGSACQVGLLQERFFEKLQQDTALLLVHAINPYGFSHLRRVDENNVDPNRNFFTPGSAPENPDYGYLHQYLVPSAWNDAAKEAADKMLQKFIDVRGKRAYQTAVTSGQYVEPGGLFYGGTEPVWTHLNLRKVVDNYMTRAKRVIWIDVHTGVGPYGYGEPILIDSNIEDRYHTARSWFGEKTTDMMGEDCISAVVEGPISNALRWGVADSNTDYMVISLEYGTRPVPQVVDALRADNWLYLHPEADEQTRAQIKAAIRDAFYVEEDKWKQMVWAQFREAFDGALQGFVH